MRSGFFIVTFVNILLVESGLILAKYVTEAPTIDQDLFSLPITGDNDNSQETLAQIQQYDDHDRFEPEIDKKAVEKIKKPCAIVVLSNIQNPSVQSLLRKYRYDANGILIPGSVKYFIKMPQGVKSSPLLVPLNDKAFSPLGGFVRYYKEVPPIPQAW